jgi:hypothetical protein
MDLVRKTVMKQVIQQVLFKNRVTNVAETLRLNMKNVPPTVKKAKLKKWRGHFSTVKWCDGDKIGRQKKDITIISTFHDDTLRTINKALK